MGKSKLEEETEKTKPIVKLTPLKKTGVNTKTREGLDTLLQIYECGGWLWKNGDLPTSFGYWRNNREETCIDAGISKLEKTRLKYGNIEFYSKEKWRIISLLTFYNIQKITPEKIKEINSWFDKYKPDRASKE